jgi:putative DNA primase/helicase
VLAGLDRVVKQKGFSRCEAGEIELAQYKRESDTVAMFIYENDFQPSENKNIKLKYLYRSYKDYCEDGNYRACSNKEFAKRLRKQGFRIEKIRNGTDIYIEKIEIISEEANIS